MSKELSKELLNRNAWEQSKVDSSVEDNKTVRKNGVKNVKGDSKG